MIRSDRDEMARLDDLEVKALAYLAKARARNDLRAEVRAIKFLRAIHHAILICSGHRTASMGFATAR